VALVPNLGKGFATSGKDSSLVVFDLKTFATLARLPADGAKPDAILFDSASQRVFVGLAGSNALAAFDVATSKLAGTVTLQGNPELMAVDGKGMLYVNIEDKSQIVAIDARTLKSTATWPLAPCEEPTGLALDPVAKRLFAGCSNHMLVVVDAASGKVLTHLPVGDHIDGVVFDPDLKRAYASGGDGTLTVIQETDADHFKVLETVATKKGARTIALNAKTHHLYLPTADYGPAPAATPEQPKPRPTVLPGTFSVLDVFPAR
jgi:DNA-binding beta-propeller fold protein YncE